MPIYHQETSSTGTKYYKQPYAMLDNAESSYIALDCYHATGEALGNRVYIEPSEETRFGAFVTDYRSTFGDGLPWVGSEGTNNGMCLVENLPAPYYHRYCVNDNQTDKALYGSSYARYDEKLHRKNITIPNSNPKSNYAYISGFQMDDPTIAGFYGVIGCLWRSKAIVRTAGDCTFSRWGHIVTQGNSAADYYTTKGTDYGISDACVSVWNTSEAGDDGIDAISLYYTTANIFRTETTTDNKTYNWWLLSAVWSVTFNGKYNASAAYRWLSNPIFEVRGGSNSQWWAFYVDTYNVAIYSSAW